MDKSAIKQIGDITFTNRYDFEGLAKFFDNVMESDCDYVVAIARRCFALQNIFVQYRNKKNKRIISDNALLLYADKFAQHYIDKGRFPTVLLVDDLLLYGRKVAHWLHDFEELICVELMKLRETDTISDNEKFYIHRDFMDAINIYVYAMNVAPLLIGSIYKRQVRKETERYTNDLKGLSQSISNFIQEVGEPNTSYRLSLQIPTAILRSLVDGSLFNASFECRYRGELRRVYALNDCSGSRFIPFVYTHGEECFNSNKHTWVTGISVGGNIKATDFDEICEATICILNDAHEGQGTEKYKFLTKLLGQKEIQSQRTQFISFILSVINIHDFFRTIGFNIAYAKTPNNLRQIEHISDNFGLRTDLKDCFSAIAFDTGLVANLKMALYQHFKTCPGELAVENITPTSADGNKDDKIIDWIEEVFQQVGMEADKEAFDISMYEKRFEPQKTSADILSLSTWLDKMNENAPKEESSSVSLYSRLAHLITIVDSGLAALNFAYDSEDETIYYSVKAGELSTFSIPRKIHWFIPALTHIEKNYYGTGYTAKELVKKFIEHLSTYKPESGQYEKYAIDAENAARQYLIQHGQAFADWLYNTGHAFRCWNVELLTFSDWREENKANSELNYFTFLMRNSARRKLYVEEAKRFMKNY